MPIQLPPIAKTDHIMILGVHHPAICVPDMGTALNFYCGVLGFEIVMEAEIPPGIKPMNTAFGIDDASFEVKMVKKGNSCIEIFAFTQTEAGDIDRPLNKVGISHIALTSDDISNDYVYLSENGVRFNAAILGRTPTRFAYGRDPFGNVLELLEQHKPDAPEALTY